MVVARTAEPLAVPLARACSFPVEGPTCMTLSCLCGRALLVLISLRLVLRTAEPARNQCEGEVAELACLSCPSCLCAVCKCGLFVLSVVSVCHV